VCSQVAVITTMASKERGKRKRKGDITKALSWEMVFAIAI